MKLEDIGFYTLNNKRAKNVTASSPLQRCELIITDRCNLRCPYCRGLEQHLRGDIPLPLAQTILQSWVDEGLKNVRLSGGEPTLYPYLDTLIKGLKSSNVERIAISTNGTASLKRYKELVALGVNDFSISLDAGCCSTNIPMTGGCKDAWEQASTAIRELSKLTYVTVGVVFNESNYEEAMETIRYIDGLNPSDIRIIPSAQYNKDLINLKQLPKSFLLKYPILNYRVTNLLDGKSIRGIGDDDSARCPLVLDDMAVVKNYHYPCIIYLREQGMPIGQVNTGEHVRAERHEWYLEHDVKRDPICKKNCLDVCVQYNRAVRDFKA